MLAVKLMWRKILASMAIVLRLPLIPIGLLVPIPEIFAMLRVFFDRYITDRNVKVRANSGIIKSCIFVKIIRLLLLLLPVSIVGKSVSISHRVRIVSRSWSSASKLLGSS